MKQRRTGIATIAAVLLLWGNGAAIGQISGSWIGGTGSWSDPSHWSSNPAIPGGGGAATFGPSREATFDVSLDVPVDLGSLFITGPPRVRFTGGPFNFSGPAVVHIQRSNQSPSRGGVPVFESGSSGSAELNKSGNGDLILNGIGIYSGGTRITGGRATAPDQALGTGFVILDGGAFTPFGSTTFSRAILLEAGGGTLAASSISFSGVISGIGSLRTQSGSGSAGFVRLSATNTYTVATVFGGGTNVLSHGGSILNTPLVTAFSSLQVDNSFGSPTNRINDAARLVVSGAQVQTIRGSGETVATLTVGASYSTLSGFRNFLAS